MNEDVKVYMQCARHPTQFYTGFCSSCLVERLSNVNPRERNLEASLPVEDEIVNIPNANLRSEMKPAEETRVRKTLQLLFQLDDVSGVDIGEHCIDDDQGPSNIDVIKGESSGASCHRKCFNNENVEVSSCSGDRVEESSACIAGDIGDNAKNNSLLDDDMLSKGWFSSMFSKKQLKWRSMSVTRREDLPVKCESCNRLDGEQFDGTPNTRQCCDWRLCHDSVKCSLDPPRHSWDGSVVSKAFGCSFACLEEREGHSRKIKRCLPDLPASEAPKENNSTNAREQAVPVSSGTDEPLSSEGGLSEQFAERNHEESLPPESVLKVRATNVRSWSKVWDWSITSPFRDILKKREHFADRSLSETWGKESNGRSTGNTDNTEIGGIISNSKVVSAKVCQLNKGSISNTDLNSKNLRSEGQYKRDFQLSRNRTVHFSSPGNFDHGLLRFYLTPLSSSRRYTGKRRGRKSRSLTRGIFGFQ